MTTLEQPVVRGARFFLAHTPGLVRYGSRPSRDIAHEPSLEAQIGARLRVFAEAAAYPPNQTMLGRLSPDALAKLPRPWFEHRAGVERWGPHGEIMPEEEFFALLMVFDSAGLVSLSEDFAATIRPALQAHPLLTEGDIARLKGVAEARIEETLRGTLPALPLRGREGRRIGCIRGDHAEDNTLFPDVLLENLACKVTAIMALRALLEQEKVDLRKVGYVLNSGEEAVGDRYQRGGGNLAKAVAEMSGCSCATGVDIKGFCCGPVHALALASSLVASRVYDHVAVVGGCSLAKLGMKYRGHLDAGQPILEDTLVGAAVLVSADDGRSPVFRLDSLGRHTVEAGSSQRAIFEHLVSHPLRRLGLKFLDIDRFATELHNPEVTEPAGSGNVPLLNYRMLAGLAALEKEIDPGDVERFVAERGVTGFSPTQGHIASALPFMAHAVDGLREGTLRRTLFLAKGSLFLGRMTQQADGLSFILERNGR
ncbi:MAG: glycine/sarcosine/betaine reductase complex component C subunit beta [Betaproteobacteria bacterium]|nr:glycine/sarcosine/betaine reductase complex component C subunit beta [Betaproteobacteria bacterium]